MSMPAFAVVDAALTRDAAINQVLASIAMEELGLSHILNAEGEKIQFAVGTLEGTEGQIAGDVTVEDLIALDNSVTTTLGAMTDIQTALLTKLQAALAADTTEEAAPAQ